MNSTKTYVKIHGRGLEGETAKQLKRICVLACLHAKYNHVATEVCGTDVFAFRLSPRECVAFEIEVGDGKNIVRNLIRNRSNGATRCIVVAVSERLRQSIIRKLNRERPELLKNAAVITIEELQNHL